MEGDGKITLHSDRGSQFTSGYYQRYLKQQGLACIMSTVVHCADNAACEGFFGMIKRERTNHPEYRSPNGERADAFNYIERFHNPRRRRKVAAQYRNFVAFFKPSLETGQPPIAYNSEIGFIHE